jgi:hypothetical protein
MNVPGCSGRFLGRFVLSRLVLFTDKCYRPHEPRGSGNCLPAIIARSGAIMSKPGTTRRRVLCAAAALPALALPTPVIARSEATRQSSSVANEIWNARLSRYQALAERAKAAAETGWFRAANDRYYRACEDSEADPDAAFDRLDRAEDLDWRRCTEPLHKAAGNYGDSALISRSWNYGDSALISRSCRLP